MRAGKDFNPFPNLVPFQGGVFQNTRCGVRIEIRQCRIRLLQSALASEGFQAQR